MPGRTSCKKLAAALRIYPERRWPCYRELLNARHREAGVYSSLAIRRTGYLAAGPRCRFQFPRGRRE